MMNLVKSQICISDVSNAANEVNSIENMFKKHKTGRNRLCCSSFLYSDGES